MNALIVYNPRAGNGRGERLAAVARSRLEAAGWTVDQSRSRLPIERARRRQPGFGDRALAADVVIAVGGDGTVREVLTDLKTLERTPPLAIVPAGNANVLAREFHIPLDAEAAVDLVLDGRTRAIDCGVANDQFFLAMAGIGYDAIAVRWLHTLRATRLGSLVYRLPGGADALYLLVGLAALFRFAPTRLTTTSDGARTWKGLATVAVLNTAQYAKHWSLAPDACAHDGWLNTRFERGALFLRPILALGASMLRRRAPACVARYGRTRELRIRAERSFAWQLDGEPMPPASSLTIRMLPAFFDLVVPARDG